MDISDVESCELNVNELIEEVEDAGFQDIDDLVPDVGQSEIEKLAVRLTNQLVQFQGCCRDCHISQTQLFFPPGSVLVFGREQLPP
jgi:Fe-S cluster biogenesis protein NfuA